jgi:hypothetical protein
MAKRMLRIFIRIVSETFSGIVVKRGGVMKKMFSIMLAFAIATIALLIDTEACAGGHGEGLDLWTESTVLARACSPGEYGISKTN